MKTYTDKQKRIIEELKPLGIGGWHATHGLAQGFKCAYCDADYLASYDAYYSLCYDHIVPKCLGGEDTEENTVACCRACNYLKRIYDPVGNSRAELIADARRYVKERRALKEREVALIRRLIRGNDNA